MSEIISAKQNQSDYNQQSFVGGMNLLGDDTQLSTNQYRAGFDLTNRYSSLDPILASVIDTSVPVGVIQELVTFGNYLVIFVNGFAYYRLFSDTTWTQIANFSMSTNAPRYWTVAIPVATTNYVRYAASGTVISTVANSLGLAQILSIAGASNGNLPGLLVQDNINQPQFIFINGQGLPEARVTQNFEQWMISYVDATDTVVATIGNQSGDMREYVPIGNCMAWVQGILYLVSPDFTTILRSVNGRPLDFTINVTNILATNASASTILNSNGVKITIPPFTQIPGGDAYTTAYTVGVGAISCIRALSTGGLFVSASNANFSVTLNTTPGAPTLFGEYTFIRTPLFEATCLSDRAIFDSKGDTKFIDLTGVRSFNAIEQAQNEGRNTPFTAQIQAAFGSDTNPIVQTNTIVAAILYNDYELYALNTIFGFGIAKYDTINSCWTSFDLQQGNGKGIKILAKIELGTRRLLAVTTDNTLYTLYAGPGITTASFRSTGICSNILYANTNIRMNNPRYEVKPLEARVIINQMTEECDATLNLFVDNRTTKQYGQTKKIPYVAPTKSSIGNNLLPDIDTQLVNLYYNMPESGIGWKSHITFSWTNGSVTQFSMNLMESTPSNPIKTQGLGV